MNELKHAVLAIAVLLGAAVAAPAWAKLPPPSDEAKAKAAETAAKTAHNGKLDNYKLCKSMDRLAQTYFEQAKKAGKTVPAATTTEACADPGPFVYTPPVPASGAAVTAAAPAAPAAPPAAAASAAAAPKK